MRWEVFWCVGPLWVSIPGLFELALHCAASSAFACNAEGLAGTRAGPNGKLVWPPCESEGVTPNADAGEEVRLREALELAGGDVSDAALFDVAFGDVSGG